MNPSGSDKSAINFNVIGEAFELLKVKWAPFAVATLLIYVAMFVAYIVGVVLLAGVIGGLSSAMGDNAALAMIPMMFVVGLIFAAVGAVAVGGLTNMAFKAWRGQEVAAGDVMSGFSMFMPLAIGMLIVYVATFLGYIVCIIPGLIIAGLSMYTMPLIIDKKMAPMEAFKTSIDMLKPQMWMALGFMLVIGLIAQIGSYLCGVGALFTIPLAILALVRQYMNAVGDTTVATAGISPYPRGDSAPPAAAPTDPPSDPPAPPTDPL